jgi:hypothetical protein
MEAVTPAGSTPSARGDGSDGALQHIRQSAARGDVVVGLAAAALARRRALARRHGSDALGTERLRRDGGEHDRGMHADVRARLLRPEGPEGIRVDAADGVVPEGHV